ncbi:Insulin-like growth factor-binding protein complex acid labile subunit [Holothuria leucospilota]|uniref:Insulin-like growth factor-binding protein complex acid labile subunit n=1 Tax=Holothuria leucospilota TaxID=206669 RepID=A0A9Q1HIR6_HOLLE|nr:Insulin-like growth factor-binding protein complex acid labile subunit [Holothuria leucospilota]
MMNGGMLLWITEVALLGSIHSLGVDCSDKTECDDRYNCWGDEEFFVFDCSNRALRKPPQDIPDNVTHLNLSNNAFSEISKDHFSSLMEVRFLNLSSNNLRKLEHGIFSDLRNVTNLDFSYNKLQEIPDGLFANMTMLNNLNAAGNQIEKITRESFRGMGPNVTVLNLFRNSISVLEEDLFTDIVLTDTLDISRNSIEELPPRLFHTNNVSHSVKEIYLNSNKLRIIKSQTFRGLSELKTLCLFGNQISVIEIDAFLGIGINSVIYLFQNNLSDIRAFSFNNKNISQVHLYGNNIRHISRTALSGLATNTLVLLSCENIEELASTAVEIECVNSNNPPSINTSRRTATTFSRSGFKCEEGYEGNFSCRPCSPGYFGNGKGKCEECPPGGYYQDELGALGEDPTKLGCKQCPNGTFVIDGLGTGIDKCQVCPEGTIASMSAGFRACFCENQHGRVNRFELCALCSTKGINCSGQDYQFLDPGFYWNWDFDGANITQYKAFAENLRNETKHFDRSTTEYTGDMPKVYECPRKESCENKEDNLNGSCAPGYTGRFCLKCRNEFYSVLGNCFPCPETFFVIMEYLGILSLAIAFYMIILSQYKKNRSCPQNERNFTDVVVSRTKIVLGFYQVVGPFFTSLHSISWEGGWYPIGKVISVVNVNILSIFVHPQCLNKKLVLDPSLKFIIGMAVQVTILVAPFTFYCFCKFYLRYTQRRAVPQTNTSVTSQAEVIKSRLQTFVVAALYVTYLPICNIVFQLYPRGCRTFCWDKEDSHCVSVLRADYDVSCGKLELYQYFAAVGTVVYVVAGPVVISFLLWKFRRLPTSNDELSRPTSTFLTYGDKEEIGTLGKSENVDRPDVRPEFPVWLHFLSENYKSEFWFWESIDLTRKVTHIMLITLLGWEQKTTSFITVSMSVFFMTVHVRYFPMRDTFDQRLQVLVSLAVILTNVVVTAVVVPEGHERDISRYLILLNMVILVIITVEIIFRFMRHVIKPHMRPRMSSSVFTFRGIRRIRSDQQTTPLLVNKCIN